MSEELTKVTCPECESQGLTPERFDILSSIKTLVHNPPFYNGEGAKITHDTNRTTEKLRCSNGHTFTRNAPPSNTAITWNVSAPPNTTVKVDAYIPRLDEAMEIIKELSESNGTERGSIGQRCFSCNAKDDSISNLKHEDTCLISRAYRLVWQGKYA